VSWGKKPYVLKLNGDLYDRESGACIGQMFPSGYGWIIRGVISTGTTSSPSRVKSGNSGQRRMGSRPRRTEAWQVEKGTVRP